MQVPLRITTEPQLGTTTLMSVAKALAECMLGSHISQLQVSSRERNESTSTCGHHAHRAAHDQSRRRSLAASDSPLDMSSGAKVLFQVIVGARQVCDLIALKKSLPITLGDFVEVGDGASQSAQPLLLVCHRLQELQILLLEGTHRALLGIGEQVSGLMQPEIGLSDRRPELFRCPQSGLHKSLQSVQFLGEPLFSATRLIESSMACRRFSTWSPSASSGGCPSSVSARELPGSSRAPPGLPHRFALPAPVQADAPRGPVF